MQKLLLVCYQEIAPQAKSGKYFQIWFFPRFRGKKWRRSEHAHASYPGLFFRPPGFSPYMGREKGEFRDWTRGLSASGSFLPLPYPHRPFFGSRPISRAGKIPKTPFLGFFAPKPYGNACYAGYSYISVITRDQSFLFFHGSG